MSCQLHQFYSDGELIQHSTFICLPPTHPTRSFLTKNHTVSTLPPLSTSGLLVHHSPNVQIPRQWRHVSVKLTNDRVDCDDCVVRTTARHTHISPPSLESARSISFKSHEERLVQRALVYSARVCAQIFIVQKSSSSADAEQEAVRVCFAAWLCVLLN